MEQVLKCGQGGSKVKSHKIQRVLQAIVIGLLVAILCAPQAQASGSFQLAGLSVAGSGRYKSSEIMPATGLKMGSSVTLADIKQAANRLASTRVFAGVDYRYETFGKAITVTFSVQDANDLLPCRFGNFVWFSRQELMQDLRSHVPLFQGSVPPAGKMLKEVEAQLRAMLKSRGIHAQVQFAVQGGIRKGVDGIEFTEAGVALPVTKIEFPGVKGIDVSLLQKAARPLLNQNYDAPFIQSFSQGALRRIYRQEGYLQAQFGEPVPHLLAGSATSNAVEVTLPVSEGEQYDLKGITWSGQSAIPYAKLAKLLHAKVGRPLNAVELHEEVLGILPLFHRMGYFLADVTPKPILDNATHTAVYQIQIHQGALYHMGTLQIAGVDASHARTLERLCRLRPGDPYRADYWNKFFRKALPHLPRSSSGWKIRTVQKIRSKTKTVNVRLIFSAAATL